MEQTVVVLIVLVALMAVAIVLAVVLAFRQPPGRPLMLDKLYPYEIWVYDNLYPDAPLVETWERVLDKFDALAARATPLLKHTAGGVLRALRKHLEGAFKVYTKYPKEHTDEYVNRYTSAMVMMNIIVESMRDTDNYFGDAADQRGTVEMLEPFMREFTAALTSLRPPARFESEASRNPILNR